MYAFSTYPFKSCNKFDASEISATIPHATAPIIIADTIINIIIELVFLVNFIFFIINLIAGSTINDIINAIKMVCKILLVWMQKINQLILV